MNVTSLLNRLSNFAPPSVPVPADRKERAVSGETDSAMDRFGPASRVGLSEQAQKLLSEFQDNIAGQTERRINVRIHRPVTYSLNHQPTPQQLAQVHKIVAQYAYDVRPDAAQRMMDELRAQGLHPEQISREMMIEAHSTEEDASTAQAAAADEDHAAAPHRTVPAASDLIAHGGFSGPTGGFMLRPAAETALVA